MRKISANLILPVSSAPLRNGIIILNPDGSISDLIDNAGYLHEEPGLEFYPGTIVPGFIIPWLRLDEFPYPGNTINKLDSELFLNGIKGIGLILTDRMVSDEVLEQMSKSPLSYHPVIELCPGSDEDEYEVFNRGIELVSRAWNEFKLSCSLTACSQAVKNGDIGRFLSEYGRSHKNMLPPEGENLKEPHSYHENQLNILKTTLLSSHDKEFEAVIRQITLDAAAKIFEDDVLGSIEKGKKPGLNLLSGYDSRVPASASKISLKVLE